MKKVFANRDCIIMVLEQGETTTTDAKFMAGMLRELGPGANGTGILGRMNLAHEIWLYSEITETFHAWKNKGHINEIIHRMEKRGINVKVTGATISRNGCASEVRFCSDKDKFLFNLKYL